MLRRWFSCSCRTATWPRRRTVSAGRRRKSSTVEERKVAKEYVEGVIMGSIAKVERRTRGVEADIRVGRQAWRRVAGRRLVGTDIEGRRDREGRMVRGGAEVGVTIRRVRMRSRGARDIAATAAAATATAKDSSGEGESIMSRPPMPDAEVPMRPESGMLRSAESMLRVHDSVVRRRKL